MPDIFLWLVAVFAGILPRRLWATLEPLPIASASIVSGLLTFAVGFFIGVDGFLAFGSRMASSQNAWMLRELAKPGASDAVALAPYATSPFTPFGFLFFTPLGLVSLYLGASGTIRTLSAWFGDPRGDFVLSAIASALAGAASAVTVRARQSARERLEGRDAPDVLRTGAWCGLDADYVVLSARRKPEWEAGAIVMTDADWFKLGGPFDMDTPAGLRTVYPLKKMDTVEVVRRGIQYELPRLSGKNKSPARS